MSPAKYFSVTFLFTTALVTDAFRLNANQENANSDGGYKCLPWKGTQLCRKTPVTATWGSDPAHYARDFEVAEKMCVSKLCDEKKGGLWKQCCLIRETLLREGAPVAEFQYEGAGVIEVPKPVKEEIPDAITIDHTDKTPAVAVTTCAAHPRTVHFSDNYKIEFDLPESKPGTVSLKCGDSAQDSDAEVTFTCGDDFNWKMDVQGRCDEALYCTATKYRLQDGTTGKMIKKHADLMFDLPRQPNKFKQTISKDIKCPWNAQNKKGKAKFACGPDGKWSLTEQNCFGAESVEGRCGELPYRVTMGEDVHTYELLAAKEGESVARGCVFGKKRAGQVHFLCKDGQWDIEKHDCHEEGAAKPASSNTASNSAGGKAAAKSGSDGECGASDFTLTLKGDKHAYPITAGAKGEKKTFDCANGEYTDGTITFECGQKQAGRWGVAGSSCKKPRAAGTVCFATRYGINGIGGPGTKVTFVLADSPTGTFEAKCGDGYTGSARFECQSSGKWKFQAEGSKCKAA